MEKKTGIKLHEESFKWTEYQNSLLTGSIEAKVEMHSAQTLRDNRHFIKTVAHDKVIKEKLNGPRNAQDSSNYNGFLAKEVRRQALHIDSSFAHKIVFILNGV